jgi:hypothetical protein
LAWSSSARTVLVIMLAQWPQLMSLMVNSIIEKLQKWKEKPHCEPCHNVKVNRASIISTPATWTSRILA